MHLPFEALSVVGAGVIAFSATNAEGTGEGWEIWLVNEDGSDLRRLVEGYDPSWSPNGLYFEKYDPGPKLYHYELATGSVRPVLEGINRDYTVECSPSGRYLAFSRDRTLMLYTIADGSLRAITDGPDYDRFASFSPDENNVVFYRETSDDGMNWLVYYEIATGQERMVPMPVQVTPAYAPRPR